MFLSQFMHLKDSSPELFFLLIIVGTFVLEDIATLAVGAMIAEKTIGFEYGLWALSIGIFLGDSGLYLIGLAIKKGLWKTEKKYLEPTLYSMMLARFIPGMRTIVYIAAGFNLVPLKKFLLIIFPSAVIWTLLIIFCTEQVLSVFQYFPTWVSWVIGLSLLALLQYLGRRIKV
jgi:membrane protein DedA with SNARE-associated domain